jgi:outer membrane protein insertion porin family
MQVHVNPYEKLMKVLCVFFFLLFFTEVFPQEEYELVSIGFEGNETFSSSILLSVILSEESPGWFYKFLNSFTPLGAPAISFDSSNIPTDLSALQFFYTANGFFKAKFSYRYDIDTTDNEAELTYIVEENTPSKYGNNYLFGFNNIPQYMMDFIVRDIYVDQNERYNQDEIQIRVDKILTILNNLGFLFTEFDSIVVFKDTVNNKADMNYYFYTGKQYSIDSIVVKKSGEGSEFVQEQLVRDLTGLKVGDIFNLEKMRRSQVRLYRTGIFNSVTLSTPDEDSVTSTNIPLIVEGTIGLMNELSPEIIMNNQQSAFNIGLGATYTRKNFLGDARKLTVSSSFGIQDIFNVNFGGLIERFSFRDTTLLGYFDSRIVLEQPFRYARPIYATLENYVTIDKQVFYNNTRYGSKLSLEFEMPRYTFLNFLKTSYNVEVSNEVYRTFNDSLSKKLISIIGAEFGSSTVDNIIFPTKGYNLSFQIEEANSLPYVIYKAFNDEFDGALFYKTVVTGSLFGSYGRIRNYIFGTKLKIGYLQTFVGDYGGIPINRTFYAGGSNSVRGWRARDLVPTEAPDVPSFLGDIGKGGTFLLEGSIESRLRFAESFGTALFVDYGNTWIGYNDFRFDGVAVATGFGIRYYSPIAPFRLDFGFKLYDPENKKFLWKNWDKSVFQNIEIHFGIGEAF